MVDDSVRGLVDVDMSSPIPMIPSDVVRLKEEVNAGNFAREVAPLDSVPLYIFKEARENFISKTALIGMIVDQGLVSLHPTSIVDSHLGSMTEEDRVRLLTGRHPRETQLGSSHGNATEEDDHVTYRWMEKWYPFRVQWPWGGQDYFELSQSYFVTLTSLLDCWAENTGKPVKQLSHLVPGSVIILHSRLRGGATNGNAKKNAKNMRKASHSKPLSFTYKKKQGDAKSGIIAGLQQLQGASPPAASSQQPAAVIAAGNPAPVVAKPRGGGGGKNKNKTTNPPNTSSQPAPPTGAVANNQASTPAPATPVATAVPQKKDRPQDKIIKVCDKLWSTKTFNVSHLDRNNRNVINPLKDMDIYDAIDGNIVGKVGVRDSFEWVRKTKSWLECANNGQTFFIKAVPVSQICVVDPYERETFVRTRLPIITCNNDAPKATKSLIATSVSFAEAKAIMAAYQSKRVADGAPLPPTGSSKHIDWINQGGYVEHGVVRNSDQTLKKIERAWLRSVSSPRKYGSWLLKCAALEGAHKSCEPQRNLHLLKRIFKEWRISINKFPPPEPVDVLSLVKAHNAEVRREKPISVRYMSLKYPWAGGDQYMLNPWEHRLQWNSGFRSYSEVTVLPSLYNELLSKSQGFKANSEIPRHLRSLIEKSDISERIPPEERPNVLHKYTQLVVQYNKLLITSDKERVPGDNDKPLAGLLNSLAHLYSILVFLSWKIVSNLVTLFSKTMDCSNLLTNIRENVSPAAILQSKFLEVGVLHCAAGIILSGALTSGQTWLSIVAQATLCVMLCIDFSMIRWMWLLCIIGSHCWREIVTFLVIAPPYALQLVLRHKLETGLILLGLNLLNRIQRNVYERKRLKTSTEKEALQTGSTDIV